MFDSERSIGINFDTDQSLASGDTKLKSEIENLKSDPEFAQEIEAIEEKIKFHAEKLKEIANVFGISQEDLTPEGDKKFLETLDKFNKLHPYDKKHCEYFQFLQNDDFLVTANQNDGFDRHLQLGYQVSQLRDTGTVTDFGHDNIIRHIQSSEEILFTKEEQEAFEYFITNEGSDKQELKYKFEAQYMFMEVKKRARQNPNLKEFVDWVEKNKYNPDAGYEFNNCLSYFSREFGEDKSKLVGQSISDIVDQKTDQNLNRLSFYGSENLQATVTLGVKTLMHIGDIYSKRARYLIHQVETGDSRFQKAYTNVDEDEGVQYHGFNIDSDFEFTSEDAVKAKEYSKLELEDV